MGADTRPQYVEYPFMFRTALRMRDSYRERITDIDAEITRKTEDLAELNRKRADAERALTDWETYCENASLKTYITEKGADKHI
jgi:hypothetical protein